MYRGFIDSSTLITFIDFLGIWILFDRFGSQATLSFWSVQSLEIVNSFTYGGVEAAQYPISIYKPWFRRILIYIIPLATVNYFPAMGILGKIDSLKYPSWLPWISPFVGFVFFIMSLQVWKIGVSHYTSTGS